MTTKKLANTQIANLLIATYNINPTEITEINRGTADIFKIKTQDKTYILKQFTQGRLASLVEKEINLINYLKEKNIKVPTYIESNNGAFYIEFENRITIVQEYIEGYTVIDNGADYVRTLECAGIFGKLVEAMKDYDGLTEE